MNVSRWFTTIPYAIVWFLCTPTRRGFRIDFLCAGYLDYICFREIHKKLPDIRIVARSKKVQKELQSYGVKSVRYPTYPHMVVMARHLARKYPLRQIRKVGIRHGAYHFKDFIKAKYYNEFDRYCMTSAHEVMLAEKRGITTGVAVGFPKLDPAFNNEFDSGILADVRTKLGIDSTKPIILFTATWDKKGYSAIDRWMHRISELKEEYTILVTVHAWTTSEKKEILRSTSCIHFIEDKDVLPYLMLADIMIGDISSIIAEFNALNKPIITFRIPHMKRFTPEISNMLEEISYRVDTFDDMTSALKKALQNPREHEKKRLYYNRLMFDELDGKAADRAVSVIKEFWRAS